MIVTEELFLELLRVATGQLDCLSRGPEPEEWQRLYEMSKAHKVEGIAYAGVEKLFEFGLRAPQDVSIEWMSEAEVIRENNELKGKPSALTAYYPEHLRDLRQADDDDLRGVSALTIQHMFRLYRRGRLNARALMDYYLTLQNTAEGYETLRGSHASFAVLGWTGIRRFARGMMWLLQQGFDLKPHSMLCEPMEKEGRYLFSQLFQGGNGLQRLSHKLLFFY